MANLDENGRKEYKQPKIYVVMINSADIIATSGSDSEDPNEDGTGGNLTPDPWG